MAIDNHQHIFFVDDELKVCQTIGEALGQLSKNVRCFTCAETCLEQLCSERCDLLITDLKISGMNGMELMLKAKHLRPCLPVLIITGYGDIPMAVKAIQMTLIQNRAIALVFHILVFVNLLNTGPGDAQQTTAIVVTR